VEASTSVTRSAPPTRSSRQALASYEHALHLYLQASDRAGEAVTRYNIAMIHRAEGNLDRAIGELELVVDLDRQVGPPDLASDTAALEQIRQERARTRKAP
jgi:tetratricopeptide (TPR) repeat protein